MKLSEEELISIIWAHTNAVDGKVEGIEEAARAIIETEKFESQPTPVPGELAESCEICDPDVPFTWAAAFGECKCNRQSPEHC
jgi:hypothetical protein